MKNTTKGRIWYEPRVSCGICHADEAVVCRAGQKPADRVSEMGYHRRYGVGLICPTCYRAMYQSQSTGGAQQ